MAFYAMVVVLEAPARGEAWEALSEITQHSRFADETQFIGDPWEVTATWPTGDDGDPAIGPEFDERELLAEHPEVDE